MVSQTNKPYVFVLFRSGEQKDVTTTERKPRHKNRRDRSKDPRTIFVGNLPISYDKKVFIDFLY